MGPHNIVIELAGVHAHFFSLLQIPRSQEGEFAQHIISDLKVKSSAWILPYLNLVVSTTAALQYRIPRVTSLNIGIPT